MLDIKDADQADFRARAFEKIISELRDKLGLLPSCQELGADQLKIPSIATYPSIFVICGPSCAGKSTTAYWMGDQYKLLHIEASDFMYKAFWERHGPGTNVRIGDFAEAALQTQPGIVAQPIAKFLEDIEASGAVVTGFRSSEEVEIFRKEVGKNTEIALLYLDACSSIRLNRAIHRGRDNITPEKFRKRDEQEIRMGLLDIAKLKDAITQPNEGDLKDLYRAVRQRFQKALKIYTSDNERRTQRQKPNRAQLESLILRTLFTEITTGKWLTTTEIAAALNLLFHEEKSKNNVSRYFNQEFHPYYELRFRERDGKRTGALEYRLSATGISRAKQIHIPPAVRRSNKRKPSNAENAQMTLPLLPK
ncbi:hypothetical protein C8235_05180 [Paracidovorax avenae]|nr:hypothetical protein C8235_05180 [Paracidovorax avenae]